MFGETAWLCTCRLRGRPSFCGADTRKACGACAALPPCLLVWVLLLSFLKFNGSCLCRIPRNGLEKKKKKALSLIFYEQRGPVELSAVMEMSVFALSNTVATGTGNVSAIEDLDF